MLRWHINNVYAGQTAAFCAAHKLDGMVNNRHKMCAYPNCMAHATFKHVGDTHPTYCGAHRADGMVQVNLRSLSSEPLCPLPTCHLSKSEKLVAAAPSEPTAWSG